MLDVVGRLAPRLEEQRWPDSTVRWVARERMTRKRIETHGGSVVIEIYTKDCTALSDAELGDMADLTVGGEGWEAGLLSKQAEKWVLVSQAFSDGKLQGFMMTTLERIGGTPSLLIGVGCVGRKRSRSAVLKSLMHEQLHKTLMAFPDEDVVVAARANGVGPFEALAGLADVRPWPETRANGEERAWGRRLAKRFAMTAFDDRTMVGVGAGDNLVLDHETLKKSDALPIFEACRREEDQHVVAWGWAMAEYLDRFQAPATA